MPNILPQREIYSPGSPSVCSSSNTWETVATFSVANDQGLVTWSADAELYWTAPALVSGDGYIRAVLEQDSVVLETTPASLPVFSTVAGVLGYAQRRVNLLQYWTFGQSENYENYVWKIQCKRSNSNFDFGVKSVYFVATNSAGNSEG